MIIAHTGLLIKLWNPVLDFSTKLKVFNAHKMMATNNIKLTETVSKLDLKESIAKWVLLVSNLQRILH